MTESIDLQTFFETIRAGAEAGARGNLQAAALIIGTASHAIVHTSVESPEGAVKRATVDLGTALAKLAYKSKRSKL